MYQHMEKYVASKKAMYQRKKQVVQRKVGIEFQVMKSKDVMKQKIPSGELVECGHGIELKKMDGYKITGDMGNYEYVIDPVDEMKVDGPFKLACACQKAADSHTNILNDLNISPNASRHGLYYNFTPTTAATTSSGITYFVRQSKKLTAHPQITTGIKLSNLNSALINLQEKMEKSTNSPKKSVKSVKDLAIAHGGTKSRLLTTQKCMFQTVLHPRLDSGFPLRTEAGIGLIKILATMVHGFNGYYEKLGMPVNAKSAMPIMPRTSLYDVCRLLSPDEAQKIKSSLTSENHKQILSHIVGNCTARKLTEYSIKKVRNCKTKQADAVLAAQGNSISDASMKIVSLKDWAQGIPIPASVTTSSPFNTFSGVDEFSGSNGYPNMSRSTDIGHDTAAAVNGILIEIRNLQRGVKCKDWGKFGRDAAYISRIMNGGMTNYKPPGGVK